MKMKLTSLALVLLLVSPALAWPIKFNIIKEQQPVQVKVGVDAPKPQQQVKVVQDAPKQQQEVKAVQDTPKKQQEKFATCAEATTKVQGYTFVQEALKQCPDLQAMQADPNVAKTFFVPSDKAIKALADYTHIPVQMLSSPKFKGLMCNVLKYHVVDGVHLKKTWTVGQQLTTMYNSAPITVTALGQQPVVTTTTGVQANIKRVLFCGNSVVFGTDAVLTPIKVPKIGLGHH